MIRWLLGVISCVLIGVSVYMTWRLLDWSELVGHIRMLAGQPGWLAVMTAGYGLSFGFKALAWKRYARVPAPFGVYLNALFYSLFANHLFPVKAGDAVRAGVLMQRTETTWDTAVHSVVAMRTLDILVLGLFSGIGALCLGLRTSWLWLYAVIGFGLMMVLFFKLSGLSRWAPLRKHVQRLREVTSTRDGLVIVAAVAVSWLLEGAVIYGVIRVLTLDVPIWQLVWANSMTIAGQVFHVTPGGLGTYESTMSGSLAILGIDWKTALTVAVMTHSFKFVFSYAVGLYALIRTPVRWLDLRGWLRIGKRKGSRHETSVHV